MANNAARILLIGTGDTKSDELIFMKSCIENAGGIALMMDVSVLGDPHYKPDYSKHDIAKAANTTIEGIIDSGDENSAMALMAAGASKLARQLYDDEKMDGTIILGGSMGTDLALDVAAALPLGVPKFVVSTISFSHLIPPDRISTDLMMILWAGGLYGLNSICKSVLSQACGAVVGAAKASVKPQTERPIIGMTSLGKSCLKYMVPLKPELEARGYEVAVFHTTGMGGRAFESVAAQNGFAAVMDFSLQEIVNHENGVLATSSGWDRLENAAKMGIPQIIAPGAVDMVDLQSWAPVPAHFANRPYHAHNRLIGSITTDNEGRRQTARTIGQKLDRAWGPVAFILPSGGIEEWDQEGEPLHDPEGLRAFTEAMRLAVKPPVEFHEIPDHINSPAFAAKALAVFDAWVADGIIPAGVL
jgi:uncharacterized protein (UPF0261 family)